MPLKTKQLDGSKDSHISSQQYLLAASREHTGKGAKLVTAVNLAGDRRGQEPLHGLLISQAPNNIPTLHVVICTDGSFISNVIILFRRWGKVRLVFFPARQTPSQRKWLWLCFFACPPVPPSLKYKQLGEGS